MRAFSDSRGKTAGRTVLKVVFAIAFIAIFASNTASMLRWSERRGVFDDLCYLRQAHLFQRFGISGIDTDLRRDTDDYFIHALKDIAAIEPSDPGRPVCHTLQPSGKWVIQYPPGTGFVLALFPEGRQAAPMFIAASAVMLALVLAALALARSTPAILACGAIGCETIYMMINPAKSSYSIAPTLPLSAAIGIATVLLLFDPRPRRAILAAGLIGALIGLAINLRITNALIAAGYLAFFGLAFLGSRKAQPFVQGIVCVAAMAIFALPTFIANAINAGSPFRTPYPAQDTTLPDLRFPAAHYYFSDIQGLFGAIALAWALWLVIAAPRRASRGVGALVALGMAINFAYFLSHDIVTPYYMLPLIIAAFSALLCDLLVRDRHTVESA